MHISLRAGNENILAGTVNTSEDLLCGFNVLCAWTVGLEHIFAIRAVYKWAENRLQGGDVHGW